MHNKYSLLTSTTKYYMNNYLKKDLKYTEPNFWILTKVNISTKMVYLLNKKIDFNLTDEELLVI